ncbi:LytR/AlgR family response regulator transcription factor, partial [Nonlabens ulvanivorans]|uniref:LytR/AlgR family response regulator transcription factor n=3 Tax=Bacteroidota TaxID=976 RepID=UPI0032975F8B
LPTLHGFLFVKVGDIIRCESDNTYTTFFITDGRKIIVSKTLKQVEEMLDEYGFFRVHNSHLINLSYLVEYLKGEGGQVKLSDGSVVDVSRRKKEEFLKHIKS